MEKCNLLCLCCVYLSLSLNSVVVCVTDTKGRQVHHKTGNRFSNEFGRSFYRLNINNFAFPMFVSAKKIIKLSFFLFSFYHQSVVLYSILSATPSPPRHLN